MALHVVTEVGRCAFCLRVVPREELYEAEHGAEICEDRLTCCAEYVRQEERGWKDHPAFARSA